MKGIPKDVRGKMDAIKASIENLVLEHDLKKTPGFIAIYIDVPGSGRVKAVSKLGGVRGYEVFSALVDLALEERELWEARKRKEEHLFRLGGSR